MTDDQHGEGTPRSAGRWDPLPQGDYDDGATAFVKLPEGGVDALLASADPLAAPGHGYVPPQITVNPATTAGTDPAATSSWAMPPAPVDGIQWPDPNAVPHTTGDDRFTYNPGATGQWNFEETGAAEAARTDPAPGHDVTGQWSIPVAGGDLPDESGEFTTSALVEQWGGTPPATLPGGAPAPWATEAAGQPWGQRSGTPDQPTGAGPGGSATEYDPGQPAHPGQHAEAGHGYGQPTGPAHDRPADSEYPHGQHADAGSGYGPPAGEGHDRPAEAWSGQEQPTAPGHGTRHEQPEAYGGVAHGREQHAADTRAPETFAGERHATEARAADLHTPETHAAERHAPRGDEPVAYAPEQPAREDHAAREPGPAGHEPEWPHSHTSEQPPARHGQPQAFPPEQPHAQGPEQPHAQAAEQPQPLPPERQSAETSAETATETHGDVPGDAPAQTVVAASQRAHGVREATEAAEHAQEAAEAVQAAERAAEAAEAAESTGPAPGDGEPGPVAAAEASAAEEPAAGPESDDGAPAPSGEEHPLASYVLRVNGVERPVTDAWIGESLLYVLRERLGLAGAKDGCSQGECGACNVQVDGRLVASCLVPAVTAAGSEVRTVEGLAVDGQPSDVQRALAKCGAVQCGFCVPGMAMTVHDLLEGNPAPTEMETRQALCGNLCRCSGYRGVVEAVKEVVGERAAHSAADAETNADEARIPHQAGPGAGGVHPSAFEPAQHNQAFGHGHGHGQGQDGGQA